LGIFGQVVHNRQHTVGIPARTATAGKIL
jgi:hypothetical protein